MAREELHPGLVRRLDDMLSRLAEIDTALRDPDTLANHERVRDLSVRRAALAPLCEKYEKLRRREREADELRAEVASTKDADYAALARDEIERLDDEAASLHESILRELVTSEDRAVGSVILEVRAGVGGDEASLWAGDLLEMYQRYAASRKWTVDELDFSPGEVGGIRAAILSISGDGAWQRLGYEGGTHQVKRVPATEAQGRIHTSTATVAVLPEPKAVDIDLKPDEVETHVTTAQGPGGQNVNKVATAVHLLHRPTGIEVRMQESKSQHQNREKAWKLLRARLYERTRRELERERSEQRVAMIGSGDRAEKIRTYRFKENLVVDHRVGRSFNLADTLAGRLDPLVDALIEEDTAKRLAAL
ncbi:MAG: PCRF domain-containing protein [Phycisphaerales bacterium]